MEIECNQVCRNDDYDKQFDELTEKYEALSMEIPRRELRKLPEEWITCKITLDPAEALPFYQSLDNPGWTVACINYDWFILEIEYAQFKELREISIKQYEQEVEDVTQGESEGTTL